MTSDERAGRHATSPEGSWGSYAITWASAKAGASVWLGAAVTVSLVGGLGVWGYRLTERAPTDIPVIRAAMSPAKTRPEEPGGEETPNQDRQAYAMISPGEGTGLREELAPGVPAPRAEDIAMARLAEEQAARAQAEAEAERADDAEVPAAQDVAVPAPRPTGSEPAEPEPDEADVAEEEPEEEASPYAPEVSPSIRARPRDLAQRAVEARRRAAAARAEAEATAAQRVADEQASRSAPGQAEPAPRAAAESVPPRPPQRPAARATSVAQNAPAPTQTQTRAQAPATPAPRGATSQAMPSPGLSTAAAASDVQVQLGAYSSRAESLAIWKRVARNHADILGGRALALQQTVSGGATWFRLRVGPFRDRAEANSVCRALKSRGQDCIVASNNQNG